MSTRDTSFQKGLEYYLWIGKTNKSVIERSSC